MAILAFAVLFSVLLLVWHLSIFIDLGIVHVKSFQHSEPLTVHVISSQHSEPLTVHVKSSQHSEPLTVDLLNVMNGELGNQMMLIAYGRIVQKIAAEDGRVNFNLRYAYPGLPVNVKAAAEIKECFHPYFSSHDENLLEFNTESSAWQEILNISLAVGSDFYINGSVASIKAGLHHIYTILDQTSKDGQNGLTVIQQHASRYNLSFPFFFVRDMIGFDMIDEYWGDIADLFTFDDAKCCGKKFPKHDETVLHIRGFNIEEPYDFDKSGMIEPSPSRMSNEILKNLTTGDKVAILSRFPKSVRNYTETLRKRGLQVRVIHGQTGVQDLCFLKSAQKEIVGGRKSTFFMTAAMINAKAKTTIYCYRQPNLPCQWMLPNKITNEVLAQKDWNFLTID